MLKYAKFFKDYAVKVHNYKLKVPIIAKLTIN